jgi:Ca2+-binding EF-hand superfamily protein
LDRDKDGSITRTDVIKLAAEKKAPAPIAAKPAQSTPVALRMFLGLDANKDGRLYEAELIKGVETWFHRIDSNNDHAVTRGEVQAVLANQPKQVARTSGPKKG